MMATCVEKENFSHYVAIDFGTAGSALAFSTTVSQEVYLLSDYSKTRAGEEIKVPTIILLDPDKRCEAFGNQALYCYQNKTVKQKDRFSQYYLFTRFKMTLYSEFPEENLIASFKVKTVDKKELPAVSVIAEVLKYFKFEFFECHKNMRLQSVSIKKIKWILTVPAIWSLAAKQIMRNAAIQAGLVLQENSVIFALEPEAAAIYCQKRLSLIPYLEQGVKKKKRYYLIADCGGGTVDIATHKLTCYDNGSTKIKELTKVHGGDLGGFAVNDKFEEMFVKMSELSDDEVTEMKQRFPDKWTKLINEFEKCKASNEKVERTIAVPKEIRKHVEQKREESMEILVNRYHTHAIKWDPGENELILFYSTLRTFNEFVIHRICLKIKQALDSCPKKHSIQTIVLVGGFSACDILHEIVTKTFSSFEVIVGPHPHLAVVKGAVIFGKEENIIYSRIMPYTVGVKVSEDKERHKCFKTEEDGQKYCDMVFHTLIKARENVKADKVHCYDFCPASDSQSHCEIFFYATTKDSIKHVDDNGCHVLGSCKIEGLPKEHTGISREIHLSVDFSSTDGIKVLAHSESDKKEITLSYNFTKEDHIPIYI